MQVTPSNALFAALSTQIQPLQRNPQNPQNQAEIGGTVDGRATPRSARAETTVSEAPQIVINANGQVEAEGALENANLREAPLAGRGGDRAFTPMGSIVDITV